MRRIAVFGWATACLFTTACGEPSKEKKVLVIGIDGVRPDVLAKANTPNIDALVADGTFAGRVESKVQTWSVPAWSSIATGVWPAKHLVTSNDFTGHDYAAYPDFLTRIELVNPELSTFVVLDWPPLGTGDSGGPLFSDMIDAKLTFDGGDGGYETADAAFIYIGNPDVVAHDTGVSAEYRAAIEAADGHVGVLVDALRSRPAYEEEDWLTLITTDHGHRDEGGHGGDSLEERTVFYLASGPSVLKGMPDIPPDLVDVAVTAMAHPGVEIDPTWRLDGRVIGLAGRD